MRSCGKRSVSLVNRRSMIIPLIDDDRTIHKDSDPIVGARRKTISTFSKVNSLRPLRDKVISIDRDPWRTTPPVKVNLEINTRKICRSRGDGRGGTASCVPVFGTISTPGRGGRRGRGWWGG